MADFYNNNIVIAGNLDGTKSTVLRPAGIHYTSTPTLTGKYLHSVVLQGSSWVISFNLPSATSTRYSSGNIDTLPSAIYYSGAISATTAMPAFGCYQGQLVFGVYSTTTTSTTTIGLITAVSGTSAAISAVFTGGCSYLAPISTSMIGRLI